MPTLHIDRLRRIPNEIPPGLLAAALLVIALIAQMPLIVNPGYWSHDELQWAAIADVAPGEIIPWVSWTALETYQFRPLTFNLWLGLSNHLFAHPFAFHAIVVAWGSLNAVLLFFLARQLGLAPWPALAGAFAFALGPFAVSVHGWVGTIGDLICLTALLATGIVAGWAKRAGLAAVAAALFTTLGLLGKEAAIVIPPLLAITWWIDNRNPTRLAATLASGVVVAMYLALRSQTLLHTSAEGTQYVISPWNAPIRWLEYHLYPQIPTVGEIFTTLAQGNYAGVLVGGALLICLLVALWQAGARYAFLFFGGGLASLAAVLPLSSSFNHYGYLFAALTALVLAAAWPRTSRFGRSVIALFAALNLVHGAVVMGMIHRVGQIQAVFSPALAATLRDVEADVLLRIRPKPGAREWVFRRLTHNIPRYRGVPVGDRVMLVGPDEPADFSIEADGRLTPLLSHKD